jgi:cold shock CspA family protein
LEAERFTGIIRMWRPDKKYGFVFSSQDDVEFFLHENDLLPKNKPKVLVGHTVEFSPSQSENGYRALNAVITSDVTVVD